MARVKAQYDSRQPLNTRKPRPSWPKLGVLVSAPIRRPDDGQMSVDITWETVKMVTNVYGVNGPPSTAAREVRHATERILTELDAAITDLTAHRERLRAELETLDQQTWIVDEPS